MVRVPFVLAVLVVLGLTFAGHSQTVNHYHFYGVQPQVVAPAMAPAVQAQPCQPAQVVAQPLPVGIPSQPCTQPAPTVTFAVAQPAPARQFVQVYAQPAQVAVQPQMVQVAVPQLAYQVVAVSPVAAPKVYTGRGITFYWPFRLHTTQAVPVQPAPAVAVQTVPICP